MDVDVCQASSNVPYQSDAQRYYRKICVCEINWMFCARVNGGTRTLTEKSRPATVHVQYML
jgi:hypothetical protein